MSTQEEDYKLPQVDPPMGKVDDGVVLPQDLPQSAQGNTLSDDRTLALTADDVDLIEKAWVEKAKAIVKETQGDPYAQNKLMSKMKADYLKKRYNRDIKVSE